MHDNDKQDTSLGWEAVATQFAAIRSNIGGDVVTAWAQHLPRNANVVDIGCGTGVPVAKALVAGGVQIYGIDPSPTLLAAFRRHFTDAPTTCETAETSRFFDRRFDGAVAIGVLFLLPGDRQCAIIKKVGRALYPGGHFLFSAPRQPCHWHDSLTGQPSRSLGEARYRELLDAAGMRVVECPVDAGGNHYLHAVAATS